LETTNKERVRAHSIASFLHSHSHSKKEEEEEDGCAPSESGKGLDTKRLSVTTHSAPFLASTAEAAAAVSMGYKLTGDRRAQHTHTSQSIDSYSLSSSSIPKYNIFVYSKGDTHKEGEPISLLLLTLLFFFLN